ncbi:Proteasome/cyclosome repeat protein, partial [Oesophagostomum dentatum]
MLVEHFNSHVRYGAAMALGIACAGTGYKEAISLLEPLLSAKENYVRQGAVIALSFIYVQQTDISCPKVGEFRKQLTKMTTEKGEDSMAKFGAIIAQGILDVGGRNMTIALHNRSGTTDMAGVVGMMAFQQFWYWHSMVPFISLACKPTCLIALTKDLQ